NSAASSAAAAAANHVAANPLSSLRDLNLLANYQAALSQTALNFSKSSAGGLVNNNAAHSNSQHQSILNAKSGANYHGYGHHHHQQAPMQAHTSKSSNSHSKSGNHSALNPPM